jgi:hypothetical protein
MTWCPDAPPFVVAPLGWNSALWQRYDPDYGRDVITPCTKLMIHHTASNVPNPGDEADFTRQIEQYGESRDGAAVEYSFLIYPTGACHGGFGDTRGCHSAQTDPSAGVNYNSTAIGVAFVGYFHPPHNDQPTDEAIATFQSWLDWMIGSGRLLPDVLVASGWNGAAGWYGHRDVFATACPGDVLYPRLGDIVQLPSESPHPPETGDDFMAQPCGFINCNAGVVGHHVDGSDYACPVDGTTFWVSPAGTIQWVHAGEQGTKSSVEAAAGRRTDTWNTPVGNPDTFGRLEGDKPHL